MTLLERIKSLANEKNATVHFKWQEKEYGNWQAESDGWMVAELLELIEPKDELLEAAKTVLQEGIDEYWEETHLAEIDQLRAAISKAENV